MKKWDLFPLNEIDLKLNKTISFFLSIEKIEQRSFTEMIIDSLGVYLQYTLNSRLKKSATNRESNHGSGVCKEHNTWYYVTKSSILSAGTGVWKISSVVCGFSSIKILIILIEFNQQNK